MTEDQDATTQKNPLVRVGIIGGGPIGLYAAFALAETGRCEVVVWEAGPEIAANVASWGFVRLFSAMALNVRPAVRAVLEARGRAIPDDATYATGAEFRKAVLSPLADYLQEARGVKIELNARVTGVARGRLLKGEGIAAMGDASRKRLPFRVVLADDDASRERVDACDVLVDASGTYSAASALRSGLGGAAAPGEARAEKCGVISRVIPDLEHVVDVAGQRVAVLGAGYSAATTLKKLADLRPESKRPRSVLWLLRSPVSRSPYVRVADDPLPQRDALAAFANDLASGADDEKTPPGFFEVLAGVGVASVEQDDKDLDGVVLVLETADGAVLKRRVDRLFSLVGYRPDPAPTSELQVHACYASDGPIKLAATLLAAKAGGAGGDCLKQAAPGVATLENPEPDFFIVGMKSYGRNSSFLLRVGYEQVDLLVDRILPPAVAASA